MHLSLIFEIFKGYSQCLRECAASVCLFRPKAVLIFEQQFINLIYELSVPIQA
jgi:hypothetical protein